MSAIYQKATPDVAERAQPIIEKHHLELENAGVKIDFVFANATVDESGVPTGPAVTHQGYPADAVARVISAKDRVMGRGDCEILINNDRWPKFSDEERNALLDHELEHFEVAVDKHGIVKTDDNNRPKLKIRKHDHQFGWFDVIAIRHGLASGEVRQFQMLCFDECGQYYLPHIGMNDHDSVKKTVRQLLPPDPERLHRAAEKFVKNVRKTIAKGGIESMTIISGDESVTIK